MKLLTLFSGIEGFGVGFEPHGFQLIGMCEWDEKARRVLRYRYPTVPISNDVQALKGMDFGPADIITFGSPCQDLSLAGQRKGLAGNRSSLFFEALRVIREMREATHGRFPEFALWENVDGAFSSNNGRDFAAVLAGLAQLGALDIGWRVLDSQYAGVPQRRDRIFLVADFRGKRVGEVLLKPPSVQGNPAQGRKSRGQRARASEANPGGAEQRGILSFDHASSNPHVSQNQTSTMLAGGNVAGRLAILAFDQANTKTTISQDVAPTLIAGGGEGRGRVAICDPAFTVDGRNHRLNQELSGTLQAKSKGYSVDYQNPVMVPENLDPGNQSGRIRVNPKVAQTLAATHGGNGVATGLYAFPPRYRVRKLTPRECERLQGFPDDWTKFGVNEKGEQVIMSDSDRYRFLGNAVTVNVVTQIAERIAQVLK